jgi:hypothetical protein
LEGFKYKESILFENREDDTMSLDIVIGKTQDILRKAEECNITLVGGPQEFGNFYLEAHFNRYVPPVKMEFHKEHDLHDLFHQTNGYLRKNNNTYTYIGSVPLEKLSILFSLEGLKTIEPLSALDLSEAEGWAPVVKNGNDVYIDPKFIPAYN